MIIETPIKLKEKCRTRGLIAEGFDKSVLQNISAKARPNYYSPISPTKSQIVPKKVWYVLQTDLLNPGAKLN